MMHSHIFAGAAGAEEVPTIGKLWEVAKAARLALRALLPETPEWVCEPYHERCTKTESVLECLAPTTAQEIAIHLRLFLVRNEQSSAAESLAFGEVPFDDAEAIGALCREYVPLWRFICELEGRELPRRS